MAVMLVGKMNEKKNVAGVTTESKNKMEKYFVTIQAKFPTDKIPFLTMAQKMILYL